MIFQQQLQRPSTFKSDDLQTIQKGECNVEGKQERKRWKGQEGGKEKGVY